MTNAPNKAALPEPSLDMSSAPEPPKLYLIVIADNSGARGQPELLALRIQIFSNHLAHIAH